MPLTGPRRMAAVIAGTPRGTHNHSMRKRSPDSGLPSTPRASAAGDGGDPRGPVPVSSIDSAPAPSRLGPPGDPGPARSYRWGITLLFAAAVLWSLNGALIKLINEGGRGPHGVTIAFYRSLFAGLFLLPLARGKLHTLRSLGRSPGDDGRPAPRGLRPAAVACVVLFTLMTASFVVANTMTKAANVIILQYTSTFWIFGLSPWVVREKPRAGDVWILGLAMAGIAIIFAGNVAASLSGLVIALASGMFFGLLTLMIRRLRDCDSAAVTVLNNLGSAALLLPAAWVIGELILSPRGWVLLVAMGVVQFGIPYYLYTLGLTRVPAHQAALITIAEPVLVPVWTYLAVKEAVPLTTVAGGGVVLMALVIFIRKARHQERVANGECGMGNGEF